MACDLTNGRLLQDCKTGMAGIKTLFFSKHGEADYTIDVDGSISDLGTVTVYRFEMVTGLGVVVETENSAEETGTTYREQVTTLSLLNIVQADLADLDALRQGRWQVYALDYNDQTRLYGMYNGATSSGGDSTSGQAPADAKQHDQIFTSRENNIAPFLKPPASPSTPYNPFEDMIGVTVTPTY